MKPKPSNPRLKICRDCNAEISKAAKTCPQCGSPSVSQAVGDLGKAMTQIGCVILLLPILIALFLSC